MALSNIFREPRREITETLIGVTAAVIIMVIPYYFAEWLEVASGGRTRGVPVFIGIFVGIALEATSVALLFFIHFIGEEICDWLDERGLRLRPRSRR